MEIIIFVKFILLLTIGAAIAFGILLIVENKTETDIWIKSLKYVHRDNTRYVFNLLFSFISNFYIAIILSSLWTTKFIIKIFKFIINKS